MKSLKIAAVALLVATPSLVAAQGCNYGHEKQAMSCAEGSVFDPETNSCKVVSG